MAIGSVKIAMPTKLYIVMLSISMLAWMPTDARSQEHNSTSSNDFYLKCVGMETRIYNDNTSEKAQIQNYYHVSGGKLYKLFGDLGNRDPNDALTAVFQPEWVDECSGKSKCVINDDKIEFGGVEKIGEEANYLSINRITGFFSSRSTSNEKSYLRIAVSWDAQGTCKKVENPTPKKF